MCCSAFGQSCRVTSSPSSPTARRPEWYCRLFAESQALCSNPPECHVVSAFHQGVKFPEEPGGVWYSLWVSDKKGMLWLQSHKYSEVSCETLEASLPLGKRTSHSAVSARRALGRGWNKRCFQPWLKLVLLKFIHI